VFEAIRVDDTIRRLINEGCDEDAIAAYAFAKSGTLAATARELVRAGITTAEEAVRISRQDRADA
jgi:general secretion pathway protein E